MSDLPNVIMLLVLLLNFFILGSSRLSACIQAVALQGAMLALLPPLMHGIGSHALLLSAGAFLLKGILIPWLLLRAMRQVKIKREVEPRIGYVPSLILGALATGGAFLFADRLPLISEHLHSLVIPTAMASLSVGFLLLITRLKAITQILGYLIFENGIFLFGILLSKAMPIMVEAGVLLDMLVAIFVMGIVINHINRDFSSIDTENLCLLRE
ncbi:MAG: hydrogenase [Deltaproteobacteria bacterium]